MAKPKENPNHDNSSNGQLDVAVENMLKSLSLSDKIAQMAQVDISQIAMNGPNQDFTKSPFEPDPVKIVYYFGIKGIGSLLAGTHDIYLSASQYRSLVLEIQNVTRTYNRPPAIIGLDSVHGAGTLQNSTITPQQINLASTFNVTSVEYAGQLAAEDTRKAGINWLFSPILGLGIEPLWSRIYETFGEDPYLVSELGKAMIRGIQKPSSSSSSLHNTDEDALLIPSRSAACAKHFIGYSAPRTGHDRAPSWIPVRHLYQYFVKPFRSAIGGDDDDNYDGDDNNNWKADKVMTIMESYSEFDGVPNVANRQTLRKLLRDDLGFQGVLVTDFEEINNLVNWHHVASDTIEAVKLALAEGSVDMSMVPYDVDGFGTNVLKSMGREERTENESPYPLHPNVINEQRIDESVRRILRLKKDLNMFEETIMPFNFTTNEAIMQQRRKQDQEIVLEIATQSVILTKNKDNSLPIGMNNEGGDTRISIHVTGPTSNSIPYQTGGWTKHWQGIPFDDPDITGTTILGATNNVENWDVSSTCGVDILGNDCSLSETKAAVKDVDYVIVCIGEENYTEKPGDIRSLELPGGQVELVKAIQQNTRGKIIVVQFGGRPRLLGDISSIADAIFIAFLPGPDAGQAVIDLILGKANPSGRLPLTYPRYADRGGTPYWHAVSDMCTGPNEEPLPHWGYEACDVEWPFGHGLSYTEFEYSNLQISSDTIVYFPPFISDDDKNKNDVFVSVKVVNTGDREGTETVMFFLFDHNRHVTPEFKRLIYFEKVSLKPKEEKIIQTEITIEHLRHIGPNDDKHMIIQGGMTFSIGVGPHVDCRAGASLCSGKISLDGGSNYIGACEAACDLWDQSGCSDDYTLSLKHCWESCTSDSSGLYSDGWGWNYVNCLESVSSQTRANSEQCWKMTTLCRDVFKKQPPTTYTKADKADDSISILVAFLSAVVSIILLLYPFYSASRRTRRGVEFAPISNNPENAIS